MNIATDPKLPPRVLDHFAAFESPWGRRRHQLYLGWKQLMWRWLVGGAYVTKRLWLAAPVGIVSLTDARGCMDEFNEDTCAHASYYAAHASHRLDWFVLSRALFRAAFAWPIAWKRRRDAAVRLPQLAGKQQA